MRWEISNPIITAFLVSAIFASQGCHARRCCTPLACTPVAVQNSISTSNAPAGVTERLDEVVANADLVADPDCGNLTVLTFQDAVCNAAKNSPQANLLQSQFLKLKSSCTEDVECPNAFDLAIETQILEERNKSASLAGQLFLGLVEIELQQKLLTEAHEKLSEVRTTIDELAKSGFATNDARQTVDQQSLELGKRESELHFNRNKTLTQLKAITGLEACTPLEISFELNPRIETLNVPAEKAKAKLTRAKLVGLQEAIENWDCCTSDAAKSVLSAANPAMALELSKVIKKCRWRLLRDLESTSDPCEPEQLKQQMQMLYEAERKLVELDIETIMHETQHAMEEFQLANLELELLSTQREKLDAKKQVAASEAYVELQENWYQQLLAKSNRISQAVSYETGQVRLAEATGELIALCGL